MRHVVIFSPISRKQHMERMLKMLDSVEKNNITFEYLFIVDTPSIDEEYANNLCKKILKENKYKLYFTKNKEPSSDTTKRRMRIAEIFNKAASVMPESYYVFCVEDDSHIESDVLEKLIKDHELLSLQSKKVGFVSGLQVGRWGYRSLGAWIIDNPTNMQKIHSIDYKKSDEVEEIDACGLYCFLVERYIFVRQNFYVNDFGPDINFGIELKKDGFSNYIDRSIDVAHIADIHVYYPIDTTDLLYFVKRGSKFVIDSVKNVKHK